MPANFQEPRRAVGGDNCDVAPEGCHLDLARQRALRRCLERSRAGPRDITDVRDGRAFSRNSEKATRRQKRVVPYRRLASATSPENRPLFSPVLLSLTLSLTLARSSFLSSAFEYVSFVRLYAFRSSASRLVGLNLPGHLHWRYLASRPRRRLLIRGFTESKTLNARRPVEIR